MKTTITVNQKEMTLEILTIEECVKAKYLTRSEATDHHTWHKGVSNFVDEKMFIYIDGIYAGQSEEKITKKQAIEIAKDTIEFCS
jgi:hypothetical protein